LGGGDDVFDNRHGIVDHAIEGGIGNDTLVVDDAKTRLAEAAGEGTDLVKSSVSYKLSANVENLTLIGKHDINGIGNADANVILGTSGENTLSGRAGADTLAGFRGDDVLTGGAGDDIFLFAKGTGHDVVTDFQHGQDHIDLAGLGGIIDFDDIMAHHVKVSGSDLLIHSGGDSIRLEHVAKSDLDFHDFYY
jgi:Ca2+-binding RTX toxin-like protein